MRDVEITESFYYGDSIVIRTISDIIYLPFLGDNKSQMIAVVDTLKARMIKKESY
ncbi:hypothetical protein SAMN05421821_102105 [Mucilaginibacter lappiensis]|uniref:Uncharacterized protein n=1 Tax=Mucilaginibacter lappiensis TaxID=354630 RepID=A0ABR6PI41_9SPHI|nr:hypothetical protein [Mucilaginibacter lappiensis]MBB6108660.1 hypothetical protein [Mucilaginibacter lappiensis]SIQ28923.1 hypothetical protein SAMN05421821_102105 [Mucilaginibacter lappiensis]